MACSCNTSCACAPSVAVGDRGLRGLPGVPPNITLSITGLPAGSPPTLLSTGVSPNLFWNFGIPAGASPVFAQPIINMLAPGSPPSATIDNTDPLAPIITLNIPDATPGVDGISAFTSLTTGFTMPDVGDVTSQVDVGETAMMLVGNWLAIGGAGAPGFSVGYMVIASVVNGTSVTLRNPGVLDGISPANGYPSGLPFNAAPGVFAISNSSPNQIMIGGRPGPMGPTGSNGVTLEVPFEYTLAFTAAPPVSVSKSFVLYMNAAPPTPATIASFYVYNYTTSTWSAGSNIAGQGGTKTFYGTDDPNTTPPIGSNLLDFYYQISALTGLVDSVWQRTGVSTWSTLGQFPGAIITQVINHSVSGPLTLDLGYRSFDVQALGDITDLAWDDTNYSEQSQWYLQITNQSGGAIALTYAVAQWSQDPVLATLPATIATGDKLFIIFQKVSAGTTYTITSCYVITAV